MTLIVLSLLVATALAAAWVICMRTGNVRAHRRYADYARSFLAEKFSLTSCSIKPEFRDLRPLKAFGMFRCVSEGKKNERFRWVVISDSTIAFFMKMHTFFLIPDYCCNLPMMSIDIIFMGRRRLFVIEVIDPAGIPDDHLKKHYAAFSRIKPEGTVLPEMPVNYWYRDILTDFSIHARTDSSADELLFETYCRYLEAYAAMAAGAEPVPAETALRIREKQMWYMETLLGQGGPAVNLLAKLMGEERQQEYVRTVMFGLQRE